MANEAYEKAVRRLSRVGIKDPTEQIAALEEEIDRYRAKIHGLEALLRGQPPRDEKQDAMLSAVLGRVAEEHEKAKGLDYVRNPLAFALYKVWKQTDRLELGEG